MSKQTAKRAEHARNAQKPEKIYDSEAYRIDKIPFNYRIKIKRPKTPTARRNGISRDCYSNLEDGVEGAHAIARSTIAEYYL